MAINDGKLQSLIPDTLHCLMNYANSASGSLYNSVLVTYANVIVAIKHA